MLIGEQAIAAELAQALRRQIGEPRYKLWFERHTLLSWTETELTVGVPNRHFEEWLQKTFADAVATAAREVFGHPMLVRFSIHPQLFQAARREQAELLAPRATAKMPAPETEEPTKAPPAEVGPSPKPTRRWRRLSEFVVGPCNRVAHAAALSVVEEPGQAANPLVLHGPVGTGKTHLLEGIYAGLRRARPTWRVTYVTAEDFTNRFVQALRFHKLPAFRKQYRECHALLIDDLQFLATKRATREEFLHTFDALLSDGHQLVVTCDCHPRLSDDFEPELADRLLGGGVWGLAPPEAETRAQILRQKAVTLGSLPEPVLTFMAEQLRGNVRELEGALNSVRHFSRVTGRPLDLAAVREALADVLRHSVRVFGLANVDEAVCAALKLPSGALQSPGRSWAVSHPRMLAMFLARKHTSASFTEVGAYFGGRNHSSVVAAEKKVRAWLADNATLNVGPLQMQAREIVERAERALLG